MLLAGASMADMLRNFQLAAQQYHACRLQLQSLAEEVARYEQAVKANYCSDLTAAQLRVDECAE